MPVRYSLLLLASALLGSFVERASAVEHVEVCRYCSGQHLLDKEAVTDRIVRKYAPDRMVDILRIKIDVTPDFDRRTLDAETTITFTPIAKPVEELKLNARMLRVSRVTGSRQIAEYVSTDKDLTILFAESIPVGQEASVTVRYSAEPKDGLYFRTEAMGYPPGDDHIWTQGEAHEAPSWFPCFDYPNERSATEVICRVPPAMTVLSNGRVVSEQIDPATGLKAVHWRQEKPHVNYLVCLVAGYFHKLEKSHGDLRLRFFSQPSLAEHAENSFRDTDAIMAYFEEEIGLPFPWDKYDQVTIRDLNFGGMENTTLTTLTHRTIFAAATENIYSSRGLDAHETAHQWFGDYVTCEDWSHLWLNEGFATYYTHLYEGHKLGRDYMLYGLYRDATERVLTQDEDTRPIVYREYEGAMEQFDFRAYPKGSWVLHMLRSQLGADIYRRAIKRYLEKHALSSVVTADLVAELEDASGRSLDQFFDQWVYHGGCPSLKVTHKWLPKDKLAHIHIEQTHEVNDKVLLFHLPTKLRFHTASGVVDHAIEIDSREHDFYVPLAEKPTVVRFDPDFTLLAKIDFEKSQAMLEQQLKLEDDVIGRVLAAVALGEKENRKAVAALQAVLNSDAFFGVRIAASKALAKIHTDEAFAALAVSLPQDDARVRLQVVTDVGRFYRDEAKRLLITTANRERNPAVAAEAISALGKYGDSQTASQIAGALRAVSLKNQVALAAIRSAGDSLNESLRPQVVQVLRERRMEFGGRRYAECLPVVAKLWREADDRTLALDLLLRGLNDPAENVRRQAVTALGELGDRRAMPLLTVLAETAEVSRLSAAAKEAVKKLDEEPAVSEELKELRKLVRELQKDQQQLQETVDGLKGKSEAKEESED